MGEQAGPPSKQVQAVKQVQELIKDGDDAVIVGVFSNERDSAYEIYIEACKYHELSAIIKACGQVIFLFMPVCSRKLCLRWVHLW